MRVRLWLISIILLLGSSCATVKPVTQVTQPTTQVPAGYVIIKKDVLTKFAEDTKELKSELDNCLKGKAQ